MESTHELSWFIKWNSVHRLLLDYGDLFCDSFPQMFNPFLNFQYPLKSYHAPKISSMPIEDPYIFKTTNIFIRSKRIFFLSLKVGKSFLGEA